MYFEKLIEKPSGIDLGPLREGGVDRMMTASKKLQLAPTELVEDLTRLKDSIKLEGDEGTNLKLIGRRHLLSNNSWMHNYQRLLKGPDRCFLMMHPVDMAKVGLRDGEEAKVTSKVGSIKIN